MPYVIKVLKPYEKRAKGQNNREQTTEVDDCVSPKTPPRARRLNRSAVKHSGYDFQQGANKSKK
jgi:hypothetical protein